MGRVWYILYGWFWCGFNRYRFKHNILWKNHPISSNYIPDVLAVSNITRHEHLAYKDPFITMKEFNDWVNKVNKNFKPKFVAYNLAFDWQQKGMI